MESKLTVYADKIRNKINKNLFGHFMEHAFGNIYGGVYEPGHPLADEDGFRTDVLQALRDVKIPVLRYPGGNFVSNYHWEDGICPAGERKRVFEYSWLAEESNEFGTIDFIKLCRKIGAEPYICTNMGTGTVEEAMHWVEFCNSSGNTYYADLRRKLGYEEPFGVKYWGLGNEMFGGWQMGFLSAEEYARKAVEFGKSMKWVDPSIELVACGYELDSEWNCTVIKHLKSLVKYISAHHYSTDWGIFDADDYWKCMYIPEYIDKLTQVMHADIIAGANDALTKIKIVWDEWNVNGWEFNGVNDDEKYSLKDTVLTGAILNTFIRRSDIIDMANYSPFVNISGAVSVHQEGIVKRAQYRAFELLALNLEEYYLNSYTECEGYELEEMIDYTGRKPEPRFNLSGGDKKRIVQTPYIDCAATCNKNMDYMVLSLINKHPEEDCLLDIQMLGREIDWKSAVCYTVYHENLYESNTLEKPENIRIRKTNLIDENNKILLKKHSINVVKLKISLPR